MEEEKLGYLYFHRRKDTNEVFYVGIGSGKGYERAKSKGGRNIFWKRVVNAHGYDIEIILDFVPYDLLEELEIIYIKLFGRTKNGGSLVNATDGGGGTLGHKRTEDEKRRISEKLKGWKRNPNMEHLKKPVIQKTLDGQFVKEWGFIKQLKHTEYNYKCVGDCCNKNRKSYKNYLWEFKNPDDIFKKRLYRQISEETKKKLSDSSKGKIRQYKRKRVVLKDLNDNIIKAYDCIKDTEKDGYTPESVSACCNGTLQTHKNMKFEYEDQELKQKTLDKLSLKPKKKVYIRKTRKKVVQKDLEGNIIKIYDCISHTKNDGHNSGLVSACCLGKRNFHHNSKWEFFN